MVWFTRTVSKYFTTKLKLKSAAGDAFCGTIDWSTVTGHFLLLLVLALYSFLGGWIFLKLESTSSASDKDFYLNSTENSTDLLQDAQFPKAKIIEYNDRTKKEAAKNYEFLYKRLVANLTKYAENTDDRLMGANGPGLTVREFWHKLTHRHRDLFNARDSKISGRDIQSRFKFRLAVAVWRDYQEYGRDRVRRLRNLLAAQLDAENLIFLNNDSPGLSRSEKFERNESENEWNIWSSTLYATTLYTTIGYGNLSPKTWQGRLATMIYAVIGMPILLVILRVNGTLIYDFVVSVNHLFRRSGAAPNSRTLNNKRYSTVGNINGGDKKRPEPDTLSSASSNGDQGADLPFFSAIILLMFWMCLCSGLFLLWERDWDYFTSWYFFFITTTTIGLGDVVPTHPRFALLAFIFVLIGLSVVSMNLNVIQGKVESIFDSLMKNIDAQYKQQQIDPDNCRMSLESAAATQNDFERESPSADDRAALESGGDREGAGSGGMGVMQMFYKKKPLHEKLVLSLLMDKHRKKMLQNYWTQKANKVNAAVQTISKIYSSVNLQCDMDDELATNMMAKDGKPRKYIYNLYD